MMLSPHFSLDELVRSSTAVRLGIDNTPPADVRANLVVLAEGLEQVRNVLLAHPIIIDSGYRCPELNQAVRGSPNSAHCLGYAADFTCPAGTPLEIVREIQRSGIKFDQLIMEGTWVHCSFDPRMRREVLTAHFEGGKVSYTEGVA